MFKKAKEIRALEYIHRMLHIEKITEQQIRDAANYYGADFTKLKEKIGIEKRRRRLEAKQIKIGFMTELKIITHFKKGDLHKHPIGIAIWSLLDKDIVDSEFYRLFCANNNLRRVNKKQPCLKAWNEFINYLKKEVGK